MKISLYLAEEIVNFVLPDQISGSFSFDQNPKEDSKLINIEAREGKWTLYSTSSVSVLYNNQTVDSIILIPYQFYWLLKDGKNYIIYTAPTLISTFVPYQFSEKSSLIIGNTKEANLIYNIPYIQGIIMKIYYKDKKMILEKGNNIIYVNNRAVSTQTYEIQNGDRLDLYGLKILFLKGYFFINMLEGQITLNEVGANVYPYIFEKEESPKDIEIKDIDLYTKNDYYSKAPRYRRIIETKKIKLDPPPEYGNQQQLPLILVIGPMITMGAMSGTMLLNTIMRINSGSTTLADSWPTLVTSTIMLISMLVWPLVTQWYNKKMEKKNKEKMIQKYTEYLNEKRTELQFEAKQQKDILFENFHTISECLEFIQRKNLNFWDKRIDQNDFMQVRLGIGNAPLDIEISYPEDGFSIEESELKRKADLLVEEFQYVEGAPIGYSFYDNFITAIMGPEEKTRPFMNNILIQLMTYYSYEDVKFVIFTNELQKSKWEYLKYLNHTFNNQKSFRFFATTNETVKSVAEYLQMEIENRLHAKVEPKPYYFIMVDDYDLVKPYGFIKTLTELSENIGFSLVILEDRLSKLPSKCNNFITLGTSSSGILKNSYENQEQTIFYDEIVYDLPMMDIARRLANIPIEFEDSIGQLPESISFLEMEKVGRVEQLNIANRWKLNDSTNSLKAEIGVDDQENLMYLDIHEKYHGPHGLIAGMTGSGKSEFIITYILSLAMNYSPEDVAFILIDYKGGGLAFAFENKRTGVILPHLAGTITNLDKAELARTLVSIDSEVKRRQHIFNEARDQLGESTIDIYKYQRFYKEGRLEEPVPHLLIICDEFAELKAQQPDFMDNLISIARIGRSLGIHLILATQKPSGVVNEQIWSNTKFRVCLKVQDEADSREMLKRTEAAHIKQAGRFYLQVGYDEYFALGQSGWCGAKYYPSEKIVKKQDKSINFINDIGFPIKNIQAVSGTKLEAKGEQLAAILNSIIDIAKMMNMKTRTLWLPNLSEDMIEEDLNKKYEISSKPFDVKASLGEYDAPEVQKQGVVVYSFLQDGNTIIYGNDGSENEMLLNTLIYSSTKNHKVEEINYYIVDYGSESLRRYHLLPHIGGMVFQGEDEKFANLIKMIKEEIQIRKALLINYNGDYYNYIKNSGQTLPIMAIIFNNFDSIFENNNQLYEILPELTRDTERYGIIFIFTASSSNSVNSKISGNFKNIYAFKLKDSFDYHTIFGMKLKNMPRETFGRGIIKHDELHEFQIAQITSEDHMHEFMKDFLEKQKRENVNIAKQIPVLPKFVRMENLELNHLSLHHVPVGMEKKTLDTIYVDYLYNLGNLICSNKLAYTDYFVQSLLMLFQKIENLDVFVFDPMNAFEGKINVTHYYENMNDSLLKLTQDIQKQIDEKSKRNGVILVYGFQRFLSKLPSVSDIDNLCQLLKKHEQISFIAVEEPAKLRNFVFESWFTSIFDLSSGVWIGRGISDQTVLRVSNFSKELTLNYKKDFGFYVSENYATLCKWIDFISEDDQDE